jgi:hypothetical protein
LHISTENRAVGRCLLFTHNMHVFKKIFQT